MNSPKTLLVVGAGGFIGGFIADTGIGRGYDTWAGVRPSTSRRYLADSRLHIIDLDYDDAAALGDTLAANAPGGRPWDYIIWNLGATKCANFADFNRINFEYLRRFVGVLRDRGLMPHRFLFMSSLSALGPGDERRYTPLGSETVPNPNTRYGLSKIKAEMFLETQPDMPWIIFRPTGVYGPRERDYLMMIKSIDNRFDFGVGYRRQMLTFIYVDDLVNAMFDAFDADVVHRKYIISEDRAYTQAEFRRIVARALGRKFVIPLKLPLWVVYATSVVAEKWGLLRMKPSTLNRDKFKIMRQRNWCCDTSDARRDFGFTTRYNLERGIDATVDAYLKDKADAKARKKAQKAQNGKNNKTTDSQRHE